MAEPIRKYALESETGEIYTLDAGGDVVKIADALHDMTAELWETCTEDLTLGDKEDDRFGNTRRLVQRSDSPTDYLALRHRALSPPGVLMLAESIEYPYDYIYGLRSFAATLTSTAGDLCRVAFSVDDGVTWIAYQGAEWIVVTPLDGPTLLEYGMTTETLASLSEEQIAPLFPPRKIRVAIGLRPENTETANILNLSYMECFYNILLQGAAETEEET